MKRLLPFTLTALLVATTVACGGGSEASDDTAADTAADTGTGTATAEPAYTPTYTDMGGREFHILCKMEGDLTKNWTDRVFLVEESDGDSVNDAIVERNSKLEEEFNCDIKSTFTPMGGLFSYTQYKEIARLVQSGDDTYDFMMPSIQDCAKLATDGMLWDLTMFDTINLDRPWWNQVFADATNIGGQLFYGNGDISLTFMRAAYAILFNKNVLARYDLESPYQIVTDGKWTMDALMEMARSAAEDLNGNGHMDSSDNIGMAMLYNSGEAFFSATGVKLVTVEDDKLTFTGDSERSIGVMQKIYDIYDEDDVTLNCDKPNLMDETYITMTNVDRGANLFSSDHALFLFGTMNNVPKMRDMDGDFGILPLPKYDLTQDRYYSYVHTWSASAAVIPITAQKPEETALFMEAAAYLASEMITPAYYDITLKTKSARDEESSAMLDLIYENRWCDLGNLYNCGSVLTQMTTLITNGRNTFASMIEKEMSGIEKELEEINNAFAENE